MKRLILLFVLLFGVSFVFAANGWGDINVGDEAAPIVNDSDEVAPVDVVPVDDDVRGTRGSVARTEYTQDFYIALGVAGVGFLIAVFFAYLFLKKPKDRWRKRNSKVVKE